jgi:hypothetical protein
MNLNMSLARSAAKPAPTEAGEASQSIGREIASLHSH